MTRTITVTGMSCDGCEANVESALNELGLDVIDVDHTADEARIEGDADPTAIRSAIEDAGYEASI